MRGQSYSRASESVQFMSNRQVIAVFVAGIVMMLAAFWAGLNIIKGSAVESTIASSNSSTNGSNKAGAAPVSKPAPSPQAAESSRAQASQEANPAPNDDPKYVVFASAHGTLEKAQEEVEKLKAQRYISAHVKMPDEENSLYRVFIGHFKLREDAQQVANELASEGRKGVMIFQAKAE